MNITQTHTVGAGQAHILGYIESLIAFAHSDADFATSLIASIVTKKWSAGSAQTSYQYSPYLQPIDQTDAISTTNWVLCTLATHPEYTVARGRLAGWAQHYESPKDLVLGIVGMAIIGPTLGIISSKKKKKRKSQLIIEESFLAQLNKEELALLTTQLTQTVIATEIRLAGGNVYNLHPDSAAWCIEEALTQIYTDTKNNIEKLSKIVATENLSHHVQKDAQGNIQALVISPSVNDSVVEESAAQQL